MKKGREYELLTLAIYQALFKRIPGTKAEINKKMKGRSGTYHQIDVYAEIPVGSHIYKTAIECKDYKHKIGMSKMRQFLGLLSDINIDKGICVTKTGFTKPAIQLSKSYGVDLIELRHPAKKDWEGRVKEIVIQMHAYIPEIQNISFELTIPQKGLEGKRFSGFANTIFLVKENDEVFKTMGKIIQENIVNDWTEKSKTANIRFDESIFLKVNKKLIPIKGLTFQYRFRAIPKEIMIDGEKTVEYILKDALTGKIAIIDKSLKNIEFKE